MSRESTRVLIVDDHRMVRAGIRSFLEPFDDISVVGEAENGGDAVKEAERLLPDVVLMDLMMPGMDGVEATRRIRAGLSRTRVLALTSFCSDELVFSALKAGAVGYLLKDSDPMELVRAIREAHRGASSLHPRVARTVLRGYSESPERDPETEALTRRELEVLELVARGHTDPEIAKRLAVSPATVRTHVCNILTRLRLANRVQAALYALQSGLVRSGEGPRPAGTRTSPFDPPSTADGSERGKVR